MATITKKAHISQPNQYDDSVDFSIETYSSYTVVKAMIQFKRGQNTEMQSQCLHQLKTAVRQPPGPSMAKLYLPDGADDVLRRVQQALPQREGTKLLVYGLENIIHDEDVEDLCHTAAEAYANELGDDCEDATFIVPAPQTRRLHGKDVQEIINMHVASMGDLANHADGQEENSNDIFPFAFVVIESPQWRRHGVTAVLLDNTFDPDDDWNDRPPEGWWWVDECETSVVALGGLRYDAVMEQDDWHNIKECQGRPTVRVGSASYVSTRSRSWSPPNISSEMRIWGFG